MTRSVFVTGAAGGIGAALCERMRRDGYYVIGLDLLHADAADLSVQCDLSDTDELRSVCSSLAESHDLSALVHNGAIQPVAAAGETSTDTWLETFRVNVLAADVLLATARDALTRNCGSMVVVGSVHGRETTARIAAYATSKAALEGWVRAAALDVGPNIRVNAVVPGAIDTPKLREGFARWGSESADSLMAKLCERTPLNAIGRPEDVAGAISFLLGDDARFITGASLVVDGGVTARLASE